MISPLLQAIYLAGGQVALAKKLGVAQCTVSTWLNRNKESPPAQHVLKIEELTGVSRYDLRPDVFGDKPQES